MCASSLLPCKLSSICCFCLGLDFFSSTRKARPVVSYDEFVKRWRRTLHIRATLNVVRQPWIGYFTWGRGEERNIFIFLLSMIISIHSFSTTHEWYWWAHDESGAGRITRHWMGRQLSPLSLGASLPWRLHSLAHWEYEFVGSWVVVGLFLSLFTIFCMYP